MKNKTFRFYRDGKMSLPMKMEDLAKEGFPKQIVNDFGDVVDGIDMQYLGILDVVGKELCERDIVRINVSDHDSEECYYYLVEWQDNCCSYAFSSKDDPVTQVIFQGEFKIVGNELESPGVLARAKGGIQYPH